MLVTQGAAKQPGHTRNKSAGVG